MISQHWSRDWLLYLLPNAGPSGADAKEYDMKVQHLLLGLAASSLLGSVAVASRPAENGRSSLELKEFMGHVMQRNAEQVWAWTALEIDKDGERYTRPQNDQDWENAESDALTLQELTYSLRNSRAIAVRDPRWVEHIDRVRVAARQSADAAERKDFQALLLAANALNDACVSCHLAFAPQLEGGIPAYPGT
jgi:hypothetical protein